MMYDFGWMIICIASSYHIFASYSPFTLLACTQAMIYDLLQSLLKSKNGIDSLFLLQ